MEKRLTQDVIDHIKNCQQRFPGHQTDIYYAKRHFEDALATLPDDPVNDVNIPSENRCVMDGHYIIPPEKYMHEIGLHESNASEFCTFMRTFEMVDHQPITYWIALFRMCN